MQSCERVSEAARAIDVKTDVTRVVSSKGNGPRQSEQLLPDCYVRFTYLHDITIISRFILGDHLSEFDTCQGKVQKFSRSWVLLLKKSYWGKLISVIFCVCGNTIS